MPLWLQRLVVIYIAAQALGGISGFIVLIYLVLHG